MTFKKLFKPYEGWEPEYSEEFINTLGHQLGKRNVDALNISRVKYGPVVLCDNDYEMHYEGCLFQFEKEVNGCKAMAIVLWCDYYQIAIGNVKVVEGEEYFESKEIHSDIDCFGLSEVLGQLREVKLPEVFEPNFYVEEGEVPRIVVDGTLKTTSHSSSL